MKNEPTTALVPARTALPARRHARSLVFDVDASQYGSGGAPCSLCGVRQNVFGDSAPRAFVRVRLNVVGGTRKIAWLCPDCIARAVLRLDRHKLWSELSPPVKASIQRMINRRKKATR